MHLSSLLLCLSLGTFVKCAAETGSDWCYHDCEHTPSKWKNLPGSFCDGERQSPINIDTNHVVTDDNLLNFTFNNFSSQHAIKSIVNTGHTVKCILEEDEVEVSGGGLNGTYSTLQFHFHWGNSEHHMGSEHKINGRQYPMEMHIVSLKKGFTKEQALADSEGIAVLGFFIDTTEDGEVSGPWSNLTSYLTKEKGLEIKMNDSISIDDLIGNVDRTKFYRYMGSLTTPNCSEAVVWTVFQEPIMVHKNLTDWFPLRTGVSRVYRPEQNVTGREVFASPATYLPPGHQWCYDEHCEYSPSNWHHLPDSHCGGKRQSPVNIETKNIMEDEYLDAFTFTKFDDKHAIELIKNTGHTVKCQLKEGMVEVAGGGLGFDYATLQLHFHWGSASHEGSEHTVDSHRYPMEMHIVNKRKDLTLAQAVGTPNGLAVLAFFIEAKSETKSSGGSEHHDTNPSSDMYAWKKLTKYLTYIKKIGSEYNVTEEISIDDLLGDVDRDSYYRYNGSLTTPSCNEAAVWTVFKEPIKVDEDLMKMFPTQTEYYNVFRPGQPLNSRKIYTRSTSAPRAAGSIMLFLLLACLTAYFV